MALHLGCLRQKYGRIEFHCLVHGGGCGSSWRCFKSRKQVHMPERGSQYMVPLQPATGTGLRRHDQVPMVILAVAYPLDRIGPMSDIARHDAAAARECAALDLRSKFAKFAFMYFTVVWIPFADPRRIKGPLGIVKDHRAVAVGADARFLSRVPHGAYGTDPYGSTMASRNLPRSVDNGTFIYGPGANGFLGSPVRAWCSAFL